MGRTIHIDPITRLEGHGQITVVLNDDDSFKDVFLQVPDFKGFEKFCEGRAAEEMPTLTQKICGVCPTAHHIASSKTLDALFATDPPPAARKVRELMHNAFIFEDHLLHFFFLGGPDFIVDTEAIDAQRNIFGMINGLGEDIGKKIIDIRKKVRALNAVISGSALYPVCGLPGGISKPVREGDRSQIKAVAKEAVAFARLTLKLFNDVALNNRRFVDLLHSDVFNLRTYYMGMVDEKNRVNFYDGSIRVVDPEGREFEKFEAADYGKHLEERVDPWSYLKILYLKTIGWKGFVDGEDSGMYRVGPLARLNAADGMTTPLAQEEYERLYDEFGKKPVHNTLAYHWARLIEVLYAAERMDELSGDEALTHPRVRNIPDQTPVEGVGICEAPRGTLFHHYETDESAIVNKLNLLVATQNNAGAISLSVEKAARAFIQDGRVTDDKLNKIEMAYRAYDPCLACATH